MYEKKTWEEMLLENREEVVEKKVFEPNNKVWITGEIEEEIRLYYEIATVQGIQKFYSFKVSSKRLSGTRDIIPIVIPENLIENFNLFKKDTYVEVSGIYRSFNEYNGSGKNHLKLYVLARDVKVYTETSLELSCREQHENVIFLDGFLWKKPVYRLTPLGKTITELYVAVNVGKKAYYFPCIAWGELAGKAKDLNVGDEVKLYGRLQSRTYLKKLSETEEEVRTAYEVSIRSFEQVK